VRSQTFVGVITAIAVVGLSIMGCWTSLPSLPGTNGTDASTIGVPTNSFSFVDIASSQRGASAKVVNDERAIGRLAYLGFMMFQNQDANMSSYVVAGALYVDPNDPLTYPSTFPKYVVMSDYVYYTGGTNPDPNTVSSVVASVSQDNPMEDNGNVYLAIRTASRFYPRDPNYPPGGPLCRLTPPDPNRGAVDGLSIYIQAGFIPIAGTHAWQYCPTLYSAASGGDKMAAMYALGWDQWTSYFYQMPYAVPFRLADPNLFGPNDPNFVSYQVPDAAFQDANSPYSFVPLNYSPGYPTCHSRHTNMTSPKPDPNHNYGYPMFRNVNSVKDPNVVAGPGYANGDIYEIGIAFSVCKLMVQ